MANLRLREVEKLEVVGIYKSSVTKKPIGFLNKECKIVY